MMKENNVEHYITPGYYKYLQYSEEFTILDTISCSDMGAFLICLQGEMHISVNMHNYVLETNSILTLLPDCVFNIEGCSRDFKGHLVVFPSVWAESSDLKENLLYFVIQIKEKPILKI